MATNHSFWREKACVPGIIRKSRAPTAVEDNELLLKVQSWAINPADHMVQDIPLPFITYPLILGEDVAGTVEIVGSATASKFKKGDRVVGLALGSSSVKPERGGFQDYVVLDCTLTSVQDPGFLVFQRRFRLPTLSGYRRSRPFLKGLSRPLIS